MEHIQHFFIVVRNSPTQSFEVFLVREEDVFANYLLKSSKKEGLIDQCFAQHKVIQLTPPLVNTSDIIPDSYRIFDMDIMKVSGSPSVKNSNISCSTRRVAMAIGFVHCSSICMTTISAYRSSCFRSITLATWLLEPIQ